MISNNCITIQKIENIVLKVSDEIEKSQRIDFSWDKYSEDQLWFELVSCILGSRVRYDTAKECTKHIQNIGLLNTTELVINPNIFKMYLVEELSKSIYPPFKSGKGSKYPYYNSKSEYIVKTCVEIYNNNSTTIKQTLRLSQEGNEAREILVNLCAGIGPKQASLFLRNIGYCDNLAILDSHVIQYMDILGLRHKKSSINSMNQYHKYENILLTYANSLNRKMATLDVAIWVVMRVIKKEFSKWV